MWRCPCTLHITITQKNGICMLPAPGAPLLTVDHVTRHPLAFRFNNDDRAPLRHVAFDEVPRLYDALRQVAQLSRDPRYEWRFPMRPGQVVVFDNQRVLHGRTAFNGYRRLTGAYINRDDWRSRLASLQHAR